MTYDRATPKQMSYLASLLGTSENHVHRLVAQRWNCSPSSAARRLTKANASQLIEQVKREKEA